MRLTCECMCVSVCASMGELASKHLHEMSFQPENSRSPESSHYLKVTFPPPSLLFLPISPKSLALLPSSSHTLSIALFRGSSQLGH